MLYLDVKKHIKGPEEIKGTSSAKAIFLVCDFKESDQIRSKIGVVLLVPILSPDIKIQLINWRFFQKHADKENQNTTQINQKMVAYVSSTLRKQVH